MMYAIARNDNNNASSCAGSGGSNNLLQPSTASTTSYYGRAATNNNQKQQQQQEPSTTTVITATVEKYYKEEKLGISITDDGYGSMIVTKISSDSTFQFSNLEVGMKVISINGVDLVNYSKYQGPKEAMKMAQSILKEAIGEVTIVAEKNQQQQQGRGGSSRASAGAGSSSSAAGSTAAGSSSSATPSSIKKKNIVIKVHKQYQDEKLGISVKRDNTGKFFVSNISTSSPFAFTQLQLNMRIISINGIDITGEQVSFAILLLKDSIGEISIVAEKETDSDYHEEDGDGGGGKQPAATTGRQQQYQPQYQPQYQQQRRRPVATDDGLLPQQQSKRPPSAPATQPLDNFLSSPVVANPRSNNNNNNNHSMMFGDDEFSVAAASFATRSNAPLEPYYVPRREQNYGPQRQMAINGRGRNLNNVFEEEEEEEVAASSLGISNPVVTTSGNIETLLYPTTGTTASTRPLDELSVVTPTANQQQAAAAAAAAAVVPTTYVTQEIVNGHVIVVKRTVYPDGRPEKIEKRFVDHARTSDDDIVQRPTLRTSSQQQNINMATTTAAAAAHNQINTTTTTTTNVATANSNNNNGMVNYGDPDVDTITAPVTFAATTTASATRTYRPPATTTTTTTTMTNQITTTKPQPAAISTAATTTTATIQNSSSTSSKYLIVPPQQQWSVVGSTTVDGKPAYIGASMDTPPAINEIDNLFAIAISQKYPKVSTSNINEYVFIFSSEEVEIDECTILAGGGWYHITTKQAWSFLTRRALAKNLKYTQTSLMHAVWLRVCSLVFTPGILIMIPIMIAHGRKSGKMRRFCKLSERRTTTMDGPSGPTQHKHFENRYSKYYQSDGSWKVPMKFLEKFRRN